MTAANANTADICYQLEPDLPVEEFRQVLISSGLGARRPIDDLPRLQQMLRAASLIVTARLQGKLVGVSRSLTDFSFCTYLSDLAVANEQQGLGIGRQLVQRTHAAAGPQTMLILLAAPGAETYYPHIGLQSHHSCWIIPREQ